MIDLSTPQMQSTFKKIQRTSAVTNIIMVLLAVGAATLALWVGEERARLKLTDWSGAVFIVLISAIGIFFIFILVWEVLIRKPYRAVLHKFVLERFLAKPTLLNRRSDVNLEIMLVGDKLTVLNSDDGQMAQLDLSPVSRYTAVCSNIVWVTKKYIKDYYFANAQKYGVTTVTLTNKISKRGTRKTILSPEKPLKNRKYSYFIKHNMV